MILKKLILGLLVLPTCFSVAKSSVVMVDRNATLSTQSLYRSLYNLGKNGQTLFGQQDATAYGIGWKTDENRSDIKTVCGYHPALYGWDVGGIEKCVKPAR